MSNSDAEQELWNAAWVHVSEQDRQRGPWVSPRRGEMPEPPWPATDNPVLRALLDQARRNLQVDGVEAVLIHLATHSWFEGGIEGYDRGQRDGARGARRLTAVVRQPDSTHCSASIRRRPSTTSATQRLTTA